MENKKRGQVDILTALLVILSSLVFVSAALTNSTNETINNITIINITLPLNETIVDNVTLENQIRENMTLINESIIINKTLNLTLPTENLTLINQSENLTLPIENQTIINETLPKKPIKNLTEIIEKNKIKLNNETIDYLKNIKNKKEEKEFIIKFRNSINESKLSNVDLDKRIERFKLTKITGEIEYIEDLIEDNEIEFLELEQDVEVLEEQIPFNIKKVKANSAWNISNGSGVKVAVLDTGIGLHNDLSLAGGVPIVNNNYYDSHGHGTKVAGVIAALLNDNGLVGVAPDLSLYSVKIMQGPTGELSDAIAGVEWAIDNNMEIVSMSFGFNSYSQIFKEVLQEAYDNGILLVAASGNEGTDNILYPAKYSSVIAVGAITENNNLAYFSSYGFEQELVAPGVDINTTTLGNTYGTDSGTSLAAPHVAGVAALIKSFNNSLTNVEIRNKLRNDALDLGDAGKDDLFGYGLVQVNLDVFNFTSINESYFYEVFNITNFRLPNESYLFWLDGTGTIDDVNFQEGHYLVNITFNDGKKKSNIYNVSENGSIFILATSLVLNDFFSADGGSSTDGIAWINDNITVKIDSNLNPLEAECFDVGPGKPSNTWDTCYFDTSAHKTECDGNDPDILCDATHTDCQISTLELQREVIDYTFYHTNTTRAKAIGDCTDVGGTQETTSTSTYYIVNKKAALCSNSTNYNISGWYGSNWIKYASGTCSAGTACVNTANFTTETANINPCIAENLCTGTVQVIAEDSSGYGLQDLLVTRDDAVNKTTNEVGVAEYNLTKTCGQDLEFVVKCDDNTTYCGTQSTALDFADDFDSLSFDCTVCTGASDLIVDLGSIGVNQKSGNIYTIKVNISISGQLSVNDLNVTVKGQHKDTGLIENENSTLIDISTSDRHKFASINLDISDINYLHVYVDPQGITQDSKINNYVLFPFVKKKIKAYLDVNVGNDLPVVNTAIENYLKAFVDEQVTQNSAQITICVGRQCSEFNSLNSYTLNDVNKLQKFGVERNKITFERNDIGTGRPYNGIVGGFWNLDNGKRYVMAYGKDIEGDVAAVKKLIGARSLFLTSTISYNERTEVIDDFDTTGIKVMDIMHNAENNQYYRKNNNKFADVITKLLNDNAFEIAIKTVKTINDNTTLRLKNVNTDLSDDYKDAVVGNRTPVVFSGGLFSDLFRWEQKSSLFGKSGLARQLADEGRDAWEIEMTGGPSTECATCANYQYEDLVDYYWPALIAGVEQYSGENVIQYIGHSNGCRVALDSLKNYSAIGKNNAGYYFDSSTGTYQLTDLASNPVDTFIGIGCPNTLNGTSRLIIRAQSKGNAVINDLKEDDISHISSRNFFRRLDPIIGYPLYFLLPDKELSVNLLDYYNKLANGTISNDAGNGLTINKLYLIIGNYELPLFLRFLDAGENNDFVVPTRDAIDINNSISSTNNDIFETDFRHDQMPDESTVHQYIKSKLRS